MNRLAVLKNFFSALSFRTGVMVGCACVVCYIASFAQMLLPVSAALKGVLWVVLFGLAKATQYTALLILGKAGIERLRKAFKSKTEEA